MTRKPQPIRIEKRARLFVLPFLLLLVFAWSLLLLGTLFLSRTGELTSVADVVTQQSAAGGLYGEALRDNRRRYKLALYKARRPEIVIIGSSRTQAFRKEFFRTDFANLGGGILTFDEADSFIDSVLASGTRPKLVLFGLDYWWFDTRRSETSKRLAFDARNESGLDIADRLLPFRWLLEKKYSIDDVLKAFSGVPADAFGPPIGALASFKHTGFRPDGSWAWLNVATGAVHDPGTEIVPLPLAPGAPLYSQQKIDHVLTLVHRLQAAGIRVVLFMPPEMSQAVNVHAQNAKDFPVFEAMHKTLKDGPTPFFDFSDATTLGSSDCEFIDSVHGGEVLAARMLRRMAGDKRTGLSNSVDGTWIDAAIGRWQGHAIIWSEAERRQFRETDFLGRGCRK